LKNAPSADNHRSFMNFSSALKKTSQKYMNKGFFKVTVPYVLPVLTAVAVIWILLFSITSDRLYAASINGQIVGYVEEESVMDRAISQLETTMSEILHETYTFEYQVSYISARATGDKLILTEDTVYQALVPYAADQVAACYSLYVNGNYIASHSSKDVFFEIIQKITSGIKANTKYCSAVTIKDEIKIAAGLIAPSGLSSAEQVETMLRGSNGNSPLTYRVEQTITHSQVLTCNTKYTEDPRRYIGDDVVVYEGKDGEQMVTAKVVSVNGVEIERVILDSVVTVPAVNKEVIQGTKVLPEMLKASGKLDSDAYFIFPTYHYFISSGYGYRYLAASKSAFHRGVDIPGDGNYCGEYTVKSSVVGTVMEAQLREGDKEHTIVIEGADGIKTCYDKMKTIQVKVGDKVTEKTVLGKRQTPIIAAASGTVIFAEYNADYGKEVLIDHGNGLVTCYAHLSVISVEVGQTVTQGEEIGKMGCTGVVTGLHVHFEVRVNDVQVNPVPYLYDCH
ncbi:MAG TPA: hypothetical protein DCY74_00215, partial [Clostridiales bacterium]|nr:hypothetical protein [Clostridiales bacterium]